MKRETKVSRGVAALFGKRRVPGRRGFLGRLRAGGKSSCRGWAGEKAGLFEHPAGVFPCCPTRADHRSSAVSKWFFRSLRGRELLLSLIRQRSIQRIHPVEDVLLSRIFRPPYGQIGQAPRTSQRGTDWNLQ